MASIGSSVGKTNNGTKDCYNTPQDQKIVIDLLNQVNAADGGTKQSPLVIVPKWGTCDTRLYTAIVNFQRTHKGLSVDGHIDPGGAAIQKLSDLASKSSAPPGGSATPAATPAKPADDTVGPPYDALDGPLLETIRRSWKEKSTKNQNLAWELGFIDNHIKLTLAETLKKLDELGHLDVLKEVYNRSKIAPAIWPKIHSILVIWTYDAGAQVSQGFDFTCDDPDTLLNLMRSLSKTDKKFCEDTTNVHGPRDCFREIIKSGPGLHMCVTQTAARSTHHHDLHIDKFQMVCETEADGHCDYHHLSKNSVEHYKDALPWWIGEQKKALDKKIEEELGKLKRGLPRPGQRGPW